ncbi:MAG: heme-binding protein [Terracidiphilus sp.]
MITLKDARKIIAAAESKAAEIGQPMSIAVADAGGNLIAHARMDGARGREASTFRSRTRIPREPSTSRPKIWPSTLSPVASSLGFMRRMTSGS